MTVTDNAATEFAARVARALDSEFVEIGRVSGGDVAEAYRIVLGDGRSVFAKTHRSPRPHFFETEASGLAWLRAADAVSFPEVLAVASDMLVLEWIEEGPPGAGTDVDLGRSLARMHMAGAECFGRADGRTTGSRGLPNEPCSEWAEFYAANRLLPLARLASDEGSLSIRCIERLERLASRLDEFRAADEPAARLHGDLWAGNRLIDTGGSSWLIDPAAHGGHREFDLAMMRLFGGYGRACFEAYDDTFPLADGWEQRVPLHQLAPLAVHAIKFGGGYSAATERALDAIGA